MACSKIYQSFSTAPYFFTFLRCHQQLPLHMFLDFMSALEQHQSCCNIAGTFLWGAISAPCHQAGPPQPSAAGIEWQRHLIKGIRNRIESGWPMKYIAFLYLGGRCSEVAFFSNLLGHWLLWRCPGRQALEYSYKRRAHEEAIDNLHNDSMISVYE